jgi:hypothetical protein
MRMAEALNGGGASNLWDYRSEYRCGEPNLTQAQFRQSGVAGARKVQGWPKNLNLAPIKGRGADGA